MNNSFTDSELSKVCDVIAVNMGLHFPVERWAILGRNLASAASEFGFHNMNEFIHWFLTSKLNKSQIEILASHLTISETYFWREPQVFAALTDHIIPELIKSKKNGDKSIRIWSAGCSTGEEPYSLAIALHKTIPGIKDWKISILATDINPKALDKAVIGIYGTWSFRNTPEWIKSRYFKQLDNHRLEVIPELRKMVTFSCLSLSRDDTFSKIGNKIDIIFCRNVLMYFTNDWQTRITQNLYNLLSDNGWFVVSSSELSSYIFPQYTPVNFPGAILYHKSKSEYKSSLDTKSIEIHEFQTKPLSFIALAKEYLEPLSDVVAKDDFKNLSSETIVNDEYQPIVKTPKESYTDKIFAIRLLANQGYLSEALSLCNEGIVLEKLTSGYYFVRASILQEMDKSTEAIASLKQGIYINPDYIMGHFTLGNIYISQNNAKTAKRYFKNTLDLLSKSLDDDIIPDSDGLSVKYIKEIIFANMHTQLTR